jgi:hypothetical protein
MHKKLFKSLLFFSITSILFFSCKPDYKTEEIPSYVTVHKTRFVSGTNYFDSTDKITDIWCSANGNLVGAFEMPCSIPILAGGQTSVRCYPGVKENGIAATRTIYPFYNPFDTTMNLIRGQKINIVPKFSYVDRTKFALNESFESAIPTFKTDSGSTHFYFLDGKGDGKYANRRCLAFDVSNDSQNFVMISKSYFEKFVPGKSIWMEVSFNTDVIIHTNLEIINLNTAQAISYDFVDLNTTNGLWNKVYLNLTDVAATYGSNISYRILFYASYNGIGTKNHAMLDNIKVLYFE